MKGPIQSLEASYLVHATEDGDKLADAVAGLLGTEEVPVVDSLEGHFGNRILSARLHLNGEEAESAFRRLLGRMTPGTRKELLSEMNVFIDEHSALFLRLDKQALVSGSVVLGAGDSVRIKVKPRAFILKGRAAEFYARMVGDA